MVAMQTIDSFGFVDSWSGRLGAVLFDMDGTLLDTERYTDVAISGVLEEYGIEGGLPPALTGGRTWISIAHSLLEAYPSLVGQVSSGSLAQAMIDTWEAIATQDVRPLPGADLAAAEAARWMGVGVVSGSPRRIVDLLLDASEVGRVIPPAVRVGGDEVAHSKPAPDGFQKGAQLVEVAPERCVVFEDSYSGVCAAKAAGCKVVLVTYACQQLEDCMAKADAVISDFTTLPDGFWKQIASPQ